MTPEKDVRWFRPNERHRHGLFRVWMVMGRNVLSSRTLIWQLFKRDFLATYKKSFLSISWIFIMPLIGIIQWVFMQRAGILNPGDVVPEYPYAAYVLLGTSLWGLFMGFYQAAASTLIAAQSIVTQVNYPHEIFLFKQTAESLAAFAITLVLNLVVLFSFGVTPSPMVLLLPLIALPMFFFAASIGLIASMVQVVAIDVSRLLQLSLGFLMYLTPVVYYPENRVGMVAFVNKWNPMTYFICSCRDIIVKGELYGPQQYAVWSAIAFVCFMISWRLFYVSEDRLIERMV